MLILTLENQFECWFKTILFIIGIDSLLTGEIKNPTHAIEVSFFMN